MNVIQRFVGQFFGDQFYCGLDIGTHKVKASLSRVVDAHTLELLAVSEAETRGLAVASINDIGEFSSCVSAAVNGVIRKTKIKVRNIHLGLGGEFIETRPSRALIPLVERGNKVVTHRDLENARHQARMLGVRLDEEVVCDMVQQFKVDDVNIALNPVGLYGRKLEVETLLVLANITRLRNLTKAVQQAGFEVNDILFNASAASELMLDKRQRHDGCVFVDLGARMTLILIFKEGLLKHFRKVPVGAEAMTQQIATQINIPFALAEDIKKSYGRVHDGRSGSMPASAEEILIKKEQGFSPVKRDLITAAIEPGVCTIIENIREAVKASSFEGQLKAGIVVVGGGALLAGFMERIEQDMHMPVVIGRNIPGLNSAVIYCVSTGLAEMGYKNTVRYKLDAQKPKDWWDGLKAKAEELSNEYF
ncbi:MAG: cell division protein FtsA [Candidatus Omnitrophica bacterium]|nr:cell division protein FtsA [Candidatus Omnitrophota bacterium]